MPFAKIIVTNSTTAGAQPNPLDLSVGELTLNVADGKLFALDTSNNVVKLSDKGFETRLSYLESNPGVWGSIAGTLTDQTDLSDALNAKVDTSDITNAVFNTSGLAYGARITLTPNSGPDATFDLVYDGDCLGVTTLDDVITIKHLDTVRSNTSAASAGVFGDAIDVVTSVSSNSKGHITGVETSTITLPSVQDITNRLTALEYVPIDITAFGVSPSDVLYEFDSSATYDLDFSWSTNKTPSIITLSSDFSTASLTGANTTYDEPSFTVTPTADGAETPHSWGLGVQDGQTTKGSTLTIRWVYPFFHGEASTDLSGGTGIENLTKLVSRKGNKTVEIDATNEFIYFAYPAYNGFLSSILDGNGFNAISSFTTHTATVTTTAGTSCSYRIYKKDSLTTINQFFQFKF